MILEINSTTAKKVNDTISNLKDKDRSVMLNGITTSRHTLFESIKNTLPIEEIKKHAANIKEKRNRMTMLPLTPQVSIP